MPEIPQEPGGRRRRSHLPLRIFIASVSKAFSTNYWHLTVLIFTTTLLAITIWFSRVTFPTSQSRNGKSFGLVSRLHFSSGLAILRTLQEVTSTCSTFAAAQTYEILEWTIAKRSSGLFLSTFMSLSPTTSPLGLLGLGMGCTSKPVDRLWSLMRLLFLLIIWLSGIVLFVNTSFGTVYEPSSTFNVTAGTGSFNGSFVAPTLRSVNGSLSYWTLATASTFLLNPQFSTTIGPILCDINDSSCESYLLPGGLQSISPNPPASNPDPVVVVQNSPGSQVEFHRNLRDGDSFTPSDCVAYGDDKFIVGLQMCLAPSSVSNGSIIAGVYVCSSGTNNGQCRGSGPRLNVSTTMTIFNRRAVVTCARSNNSILSVSDLTIPNVYPLTDVQDFQTALGWLLNYTAADLPPASSITFLFWNRNSGLSEHDWSVEAYKTLKSILGFTSWFFTENNFGNPQFSGSVTSITEPDFLPNEFHTTASTARPSTRFIIDHRMFIIYIVLQVIPLIFCWTILLWRMIAQLPPVQATSFPILDFMFKAEWCGIPLLEEVEMKKAGDKEFILDLQDVQVIAYVPDIKPSGATQTAERTQGLHLNDGFL